MLTGNCTSSPVEEEGWERLFYLFILEINLVTISSLRLFESAVNIVNTEQKT